MDIIIGIIAFVVMLCVIVTVHEFGHFVTAKKFGVFCGEFSIGMGPLLYKKQGKETQFSIRALPIGGFVSMAGEEDDTKKDVDVPFERTINGIAWWKKIIVMLAGIFMNIVLAWVIFVGIFLYTGTAVDSSSTTVATIQEGSAAEEAGFQVGDEIVSLTYENGRTMELNSSTDLRTEINLDPQTFTFHVLRGEEELDLQAAPIYDDEDQVYLLGVTTENTMKSINRLEAFSYGTGKMIDNSTLIFKSLGKLMQGKNLNQLSGPIGIYNVTQEAFHTNILTYIQLFAIISLNIGIFNALPLPILDGGRALITVLERIFGRQLNPKIYETIMYIGMFALVALMIFAIWNDVTKLMF